MSANSEQFGELAKSLAAAQAEYPPVPKTKTAEVPMKSGGKYSYKYADLADVLRAVTPALAKHGLSVSQFQEIRGNELLLVSRLMHSSNQFLESVHPLPNSWDRPQEFGTALTYARRYSLCGLIGVAADEDDDGALAQREGAARRREKPSAGEEGAKPAQQIKKPMAVKPDTNPANPKAASGPSARQVVLKKLMEVYPEYMKLYPHVNFTELLQSRYTVHEAKSLTDEQIIDFIAYMEKGLVQGAPVEPAQKGEFDNFQGTRIPTGGEQ